MAGGVGDFYDVLGLNKECSSVELKNAYKKLALRWHPDRCFASGKSEFVDEAKTRFQEIQAAYSVLSDSNKRFLYDVGAYDSENDDDKNGMGDFLGEMAQMMNDSRQFGGGGGGGGEYATFEQLQKLFVDMFQTDAGEVGGHNKRAAAAGSGMNSSDAWLGQMGAPPSSFCFGSDKPGQTSKARRGGNLGHGGGNKRRPVLRNPVSSKLGVLSQDADVPA